MSNESSPSSVSSRWKTGVMHSIWVGFAFPLHSFREQQYEANVKEEKCHVLTNLYLFALIKKLANANVVLLRYRFKTL